MIIVFILMIQVLLFPGLNKPKTRYPIAAPQAELNQGFEVIGQVPEIQPTFIKYR